MKKLLATALAIVTFGTVQAQKTDATGFANTHRYSNQNRELVKNNNFPQVVFMGNSITQMWFETNPSFFTANNYAGRGIGGQTTAQFLLRFREDVVNLKPQTVVINGGINDIAQNAGTYDEEFTLGNIKSMAQIADANGIKVILTSVLPAANIPWDSNVTNVPQKIIELNRKIKEYADQKGFVYVDYYSQMVNPQKGMIAEYTTDQVHVTPNGYKVMEKIIDNALKKNMKRKRM